MVEKVNLIPVRRMLTAEFAKALTKDLSSRSASDAYTKWSRGYEIGVQ
jgi:hypothetical protein